MVPEDLLADLGWRNAGALCQVGQMAVGGIREVQMPLAFQLAVKAVLRAHSIWSTEVSLEGMRQGVNLFWLLWAEKILKPVQRARSGLGSADAAAEQDALAWPGKVGVVHPRAGDGEEGAT